MANLSMLSRVADSLYWMARSIERSDNLARLIQVNLDLMLDARTTQVMDHWMPVILTTGDDADFIARYPKPTPENVIHFLTLDADNPNSILVSLRNARENARTVRDQISEEMWEAINDLHLFLASGDAPRLLKRAPSEFFQRILHMSYLVQGITASSLSRDSGWLFYTLGCNLERADKTTRMLDICAHLPLDPSKQNATQALRWVALLRSASAYNACQRATSGRLEPTRIIDFLLFSDDFPRSVNYCIREVDQALHTISGGSKIQYSNKAEKLSGKLLADLTYGSIEEVLSYGLHEHLDRLQLRFNEIGQSIFETFIFIPEVTHQPPPFTWGQAHADAAAYMLAQQMQQQQ